LCAVDFDTDKLVRVLGALKAEPAMEGGPGRAAVAMALRASAGGAELLLMCREERAEDRWSGQVSLPGGHWEEGDRGLVATAAREAGEEVGVDLERDARFLGLLEPLGASARGQSVELVIQPCVFLLEGEVSPSPGPEAQAVFWLPLAAVLSGELDGHVRRRYRGMRMELPSWQVEGHEVWGLTHRMVSRLLELWCG